MSRALVVLASDLSPTTKRALQPVERLASGLAADVVLLHALRGVPSTAVGLSAPPLREPRVDAEIARARQALEELRHQLPLHTTVTVEVTVGEEIASAIADFAARRGAAYLVILSHGRRGVRRLFMGSVAEGVLRRATLPVVVVPL
ncbi:MAG: universal stress protein [Planctomycetota bacterium]